MNSKTLLEKHIPERRSFKSLGLLARKTSISKLWISKDFPEVQFASIKIPERSLVNVLVMSNIYLTITEQQALAT